MIKKLAKWIPIEWSRTIIIYPCGIAVIFFAGSLALTLTDPFVLWNVIMTTVFGIEAVALFMVWRRAKKEAIV